MVHMLSLMLKCVSLPVVPALYVSFRVQREGTTYASGKRKGHLEWVRMHVQELLYPCMYLP